MRGIGVLFIAIAAVGCNGAPAAETIEVAQPIEAPPGSFVRTIVHLAKSGAATVKQQIIAGEQRRGGALRPETGVVEDEGCSYADLELYDQQYFGGNEICFFGAGGPNSFASLSDYYYTGQKCIYYKGHWLCPTWAGRIQSFAAGTQSVLFYGTSDAYYPAEAIQFTADAAVQSAGSFTLDYEPL